MRDVSTKQAALTVIGITVVLAAWYMLRPSSRLEGPTSTWPLSVCD
jgi:hypothetical protein